jgi:hypothetical protein
MGHTHLLMDAVWTAHVASGARFAGVVFRSDQTIVARSRVVLVAAPPLRCT